MTAPHLEKIIVAAFGSMVDYPYLVGQCLIEECVPNISITCTLSHVTNLFILVFHGHPLTGKTPAWLSALPNRIHVKEFISFIHKESRKEKYLWYIRPVVGI